MNVTLKPISHPAMGEINIDQTRFIVGRVIESFKSYKDKAVSRLSRRHARIFQDNGEVYIIDLGSLNGTQVNDQPVEEDVIRLFKDDQINFAGDFVFRVEMESDDSDDETLFIQPPPQLTLAPVDPDSAIEPILITRFPFLITRSHTLFGQYMEHSAEELRQISRPHAIIGLKDGEIYVEDLESANGTFLAGEKLEASPQSVEDGETISFGGSRYSYRVCLQRAEQPEQDADSTVFAGSKETTDAAVDDSQTIFVNSSASFLEMYCAENGLKKCVGSSTGQLQTSEQAAAGKSGRRKRKSRRLFTEFRRVLWKDSRINRKIVGSAIGVISIAFIMAAMPHILGADKREIKQFLDNKAYIESTLAANRYLERHPDDEDVNAWAGEALIRAIVPGWIEHIKQRRFDDAENYLTEAIKRYSSMSEGHEVIDLLAWAGRVESLFYQREGTDASIILFRDEDLIKNLVAEWDADTFKHRLLINRILAVLPSFEPLHSRVTSELRTLRTENSLYGKAISELKKQILEGIVNSAHQDIDRAIKKFVSQYPRVKGMDALKKDVDNFKLLASKIKQRGLIEVDRLHRDIEFKTPLVREGVKTLLAQALPPDEIISQYRSAAEAWRFGKRKKAIEILRMLKSETWGDVIERQAVQYTKINTAYEKLLQAKESKDYDERLLAFNALLIPDEDEYFVNAIQSDFQLIREQALSQLEEVIFSIKKQWAAFQNAGGIPGVIRVEDRVSKQFRKQAERLSIAHSEITEGTQKYNLIKTEEPAEWYELKNEILSEVRRQNQWLKDLDVVLEPDLLTAKLDLLPEIVE